MQPGDVEHGVVDAVALEAAAVEDLPALHAVEDVLDAGLDPLVRPVVLPRADPAHVDGEPHYFRDDDWAPA